MGIKCDYCDFDMSEDRSPLRINDKVYCSIECSKDDGSKKDSINPSHYKSHPSGIECIQITEHMGFTLGNAMKYIWRADLKHDDGGIEDLKKAQWYIDRELKKRTKASQT